MVILNLVPVLDLPAASPLRAMLMEHRGSDVEVDASNVERLGGLCLQVLLAAGRTWTLDCRMFRLINASEQCRGALGLTQAASALGVEE